MNIFELISNNIEKKLASVIITKMKFEKEVSVKRKEVAMEALGEISVTTSNLIVLTSFVHRDKTYSSRSSSSLKLRQFSWLEEEVTKLSGGITY